MTRNVKRAQKYSERSNHSFSDVRPYFIYLWAAPVSAIRLIFNVLHNFFFLQWRQKFHFTHRPIVFVNGEADEKIPFTPSYVKVYLSFVQFFIKPFDLIYKRLGLKNGRSFGSRSILFISRLYKNAAKIYKYCLSTTPRPNYNEMKEFRTIHFWDPHYLCVPSLHVAIASGVYSWYRQLFNEMVQKGLMEQAEADRRTAEFRAEGIAIIESVLFVKQHSVNCIPTALYLVTKTMHESGAAPEDFHSYISDIFKDVPELSDEMKAYLQGYFTQLYEQLLRDGETTDDWTLPIKKWLEAKMDIVKK